MKELFTKWFIVPDADRTKKEIISWWEIRRIAYNCLLIPSCILSFVIHAYISHLMSFEPDFSDFFLLLGLIFFIFLANVLYIGGWGIELLLRSNFKSKFNKTISYSFIAVVLLSVCIALFPGIYEIIWYVTK